MIARQTIGSGPWLARTTLEDLEGWTRDIDELSALTGKVDSVLAAWLAHVAPGVTWDPEHQALVAGLHYDGYRPDEYDVSARRLQIVSALNRVAGSWKEAKLSQLVNLGLELDVARFCHSQRPTVKGLPDFGTKPKRNVAK